MQPTDQPALTDGDVALAPTSGGSEPGQFQGFAVLVEGERAGTVALQREAADVASLRWNLGGPLAGTSVAARALRLAVSHALGDLGIARVEARIAATDASSLRAASMAGLRREGVLRGTDADEVLVARLGADPEPHSRDGFIAVLNAGLPTKRVISQGVLRDEQGRVLLCELTYKQEWDLPGGVVEVGESPGRGLVRELEEELGTTLEVRGLLTVNWLPAWRGWDDACVFVFDLGTLPADATTTMTLQPTEIRAVHWCTADDLATRATAATRELLTALDAGPLPPYREAPVSP